jgi:hypothetical protein
MAKAWDSDTELMSDPKVVKRLSNLSDEMEPVRFWKIAAESFVGVGVIDSV